MILMYSLDRGDKTFTSKGQIGFNFLGKLLG